ncbi:hypothetical protein [Neobacillus drentensis]|uniref:hypothetical protein n=1 Tax=Neobacillus drentensis TaxID=220684 RepID=UPI002FFFCCA6
MPIKGIFSGNHKRNLINSPNDDVEKQIMRINTLEVQIKRLLEFEKQVRLSMVGTDKLVKDRKSSTEQKKVDAQQELLSKSNVESKKELNLLSQRIDNLEKMVQEILLAQKANQSERAMGAECNPPRENRSDGQESSDSFTNLINMRVRELEKNYQRVNEVQAGILNQIGELVEKQNTMLEKEREETHENPIIKTLYIDKFYLDKYEQNNNIGQIGIHELSGALNIGATYGKDVIPSRVTQEVKEEIEKIKAAKEEMERQQTSTDEPDKPEKAESSSDSAPIPGEEEEHFTEIGIEEDDSSLDGDSFNI